MPSFRTFVVAAAALLTIGNTQRAYTIDPESVPIAMRQSWCGTQKATCPLLCLQLPGKSSTTEANDCDAETLNFECICGNGLTPNASEFSETLPFFLCREYGNQCVLSCSGNPACQSGCRENNPCGAQNPKLVNLTSTSSSPASTETASDGSPQGTDAVFTGFKGDSKPTKTAESGGASESGASSQSSDTPKSAANAMLDAGRNYGLAAVFASLFAGFALVM